MVWVDFVKSEEMFRASLDGREKSLGKDHQYTIDTTYNLAVLLAKSLKDKEKTRALMALYPFLFTDPRVEVASLLNAGAARSVGATLTSLNPPSSQRYHHWRGDLFNRLDPQLISFGTRVTLKGTAQNGMHGEVGGYDKAGGTYVVQLKKGG